MSNDVRNLVRRFQSNQNVQPHLKESPGINPRNTPKNHSAPAMPMGLMAEGFSNGVNTVKWARTGNKPDTIFRVEVQVRASPDFIEIGLTNALTLDHTGQAPGVKVACRVVAYRAKQASVPTIRLWFITMAAWVRPR